MIRYRNFKSIFFTLFIFLIVFQSSSLAQTINELKDKKKRIEKEIESIANMIEKTERESKTSTTNISLTKRKIDLKTNLIKQLESETNELENKISLRKQKIDSLNKRISIIREEYKRIIIYTHINQSRTNLLIQILASKDFNQAYKRLKFYQQLLVYKQQTISSYISNIHKVKEENKILGENISQLNTKQNEKEQEVKKLKSDEIIFKNKVEKLNKKKKELLVELNEQKKISVKLNEAIKILIEEEARKDAENSKKSLKSSNFLLSSNFKENKGKFRLPVDNGIIIQFYGESFHPILKEVKIKNNGIDISVSKESNVYSIFKGEVRKVFKIPGSNLAVIIRHGSFLTVYSNLSIVNVSVGQEVNSLYKIGEINLQKGEETAILHFELWNENKTEDPAKWINI